MSREDITTVSFLLSMLDSHLLLFMNCKFQRWSSGSLIFIFLFFHLSFLRNASVIRNYNNTIFSYLPKEEKHAQGSVNSYSIIVADIYIYYPKKHAKGIQRYPKNDETGSH